MTLKDLAKIIGKEGTYSPVDGFTVAIRITDVRQAYGRTDYQLEPLNGSGRVWVSSANVKL